MASFSVWSEILGGCRNSFNVFKAIDGGHGRPATQRVCNAWGSFAESEKELKKRLIDIEKKIENVEEGYYVNKDMSKDIFEKFYPN